MRTRYSPKRQGQEKGSVIVLVALSMVALLGFAALSIDVAHVHQQQRDMQSATDAAAMAGVSYLTNSDALGLAVPTAQAIAETNGVLAAEITATTVGTWDTNRLLFTASACPNCNAVLVSASRSVPLYFGKVVGFGNMAPTALSVAMLTGAGSEFGGNGAGLIPFGVDLTQATNAFYSPYTICKKTDIGGTGDYGELDFGGTWYDNMVSGCNCAVSDGEQVNTITGKNGGCQSCSDTGFTDRLANDPYIVMPVVDNWPSGSSGTATIVGFIGAEITGVTPGGGNWCVTIENVPIELGGGGGGGGSTNAPFALARVLVK